MPTPRPIGPGARLSVLLGALSMFGPFAIDAMLPAFPHMSRTFSASPFAIQQSITVYLMSYAAMSVIHGPASDAFGRKPVIVIGTLLFALGSLGCALSTSMEQLLFFRAVQGMAAGAGLIVGRAMIRDLFEGVDAQRLMSRISLIFTLAPALAPIMGGWIVASKPWTWLFWALAAFSMLLALAALWALPESHPKSRRTPLQPSLLVRELHVVIVDAQFVRLGLVGGLCLGSLFLYITSAPAIVLDILNLDDKRYGWFFLPVVAGMALGAFASDRSAGRLSPTRTISLGFALSASAGAAGMLLGAYGPTASLWSIIPICAIAFGVAWMFPSIVISMLDRHPNRRGAASSMQAVLSLSVNTLAAGLLSPAISHSTLLLGLTATAMILTAWLTWAAYLRSERTLADKAISTGMAVD